MTQEPRNLSWTHFNKVRRFPLLFSCSAVSSSGLFSIPDDLITSLYISCSLGTEQNNTGLFYISSFLYYETGFVIAISYQSASGESVKVAETTVDVSNALPSRTIPFSSVSGMFLNGFLVIGSLDGLKQQPCGEWSFNPDDAAIDPFCIRHIAHELSELYVFDGQRTLGPFHGSVTLWAGKNITMSVRTVEELNCLYPPAQGNGTEVIIHSLDPSGEPPCLKTINGVQPDASGNITFQGKECLRIYPEGQHTLTFADQCAEPCCTCAELVPIEEKINEIQASIDLLSGRMEILTTQYDFLKLALSTI